MFWLSLTQLGKNLLLSFKKTKDIDIGANDGDYENKIIKKLLFKNSNKITSYLTTKARLTFILLKKAFTKLYSFNILIQNVTSELKLIF